MHTLHGSHPRSRAFREGIRLTKLALLLIPLVLVTSFVPLPGSAKKAYAATTCPATISYGSTGSLVKQLQTALANNASFGISIDSQFGSQTRSAVIAFQQAAFPSDSSQWDGTVGPNTWGALGFCHSSGGVSGGGCTKVHAASACVSIDSNGNIVNDGYTGISNISYIEIAIIEDGAKQWACTWSNGNLTFSVGDHLMCDSLGKPGSGHSIQSITYGWDTNSTTFRVVSPTQYT